MDTKREGEIERWAKEVMRVGWAVRLDGCSTTHFTIWKPPTLSKSSLPSDSSEYALPHTQYAVPDTERERFDDAG